MLDASCSSCQAGLDESAAGGLCPACLLRLGLDDDPDAALVRMVGRKNRRLGGARASAKLWSIAIVVALGAIALIQAYDAYVWTDSPWLGVTVGDHGRLSARGAAEAPAPLRELLASQAMFAVALEVDPASGWIPLIEPRDTPAFKGWDRPRAAYDRLRRALAGSDVGDVVRLRVRDGTGAHHDVELGVGRVPTRVALERILLYHGLGLVVVLFGGFVLRARPTSGRALAFAMLAMTLGGQLLTTQVLGSFPSRFYWLSLAGCYAAPAAAATLALALYPKPWVTRRRWLASVPWLCALAGLLAASLTGRLPNDANVIVVALRLASWTFFAGYLLWARLEAESPSKARVFDYYLFGMAISLAPPTWAYARPSVHDAPVTPWVMLPVVLFPLVIGFGILKHRLFDVEVAMRRGVAYTALGLVAAAVYGVLVAIATAVLGSGKLLTAAAVTLAFIIGGSLKPRLQGVVDRRMNPTRFRYLEALRAASHELAALEDHRAVADRLVGIAVEEAGLASATVFLRRIDGYRLISASGAVNARPGTLLEPDHPLVSLAQLVGSELHRDDFGSNPRLAAVAEICLRQMDEAGSLVLLPIKKRGSGVVGLLGLGPRRDGSELNSEDIDLFTMIAAQAAGAIGRSLARGDTDSVATAAPPTPLPLRAGEQIGRYLLLSEIGRGGMGSVFQARDQSLDRVVAIKFLNPERLGSADMRERLRREARSLAALNHPNIMHIHALEEDGGHTFLVVEFLEGENLRSELDRRRQFPPAEVAGIGLALTRALDYAHQRDVIHRDVKLENVMRSDETIKLADFGLAKPSTTDDTSITQSGVVVGTPAYLAPELLEGSPATFRSDMYALGVVLLALVTGRPLNALRQALRRAPPAADELQGAGVPKPLVSLLQRLVAADRDARWDSYASLAADLERVEAELRSGLTSR